MYFLLIGILLLVLKFMEFGIVAQWSWWVVLAPFALAVAWWAWADATGYTKKKAMDKMDQRKKNRIEKKLDALGMCSKRQ